MQLIIDTGAGMYYNKTNFLKNLSEILKHFRTLRRVHASGGGNSNGG